MPKTKKKFKNPNQKKLKNQNPYFYKILTITLLITTIAGILYILYDIYQNNLKNFANSISNKSTITNNVSKLEIQEETPHLEEKQPETLKETNNLTKQPKKTEKKLFLYKLEKDKLTLIPKSITIENENTKENVYEIFKAIKTIKNSDKEISLVPQKVKLIDYKIIENTLVLNLSKEIEENEYGSKGILYSIYQIAYTLGNFTETKKVLILIEGTKPKYLGGEGIVFENPIDITKKHSLD